MLHERGDGGPRVGAAGEGDELDVEPPLHRRGRDRAAEAVPGHFVHPVEGEDPAVLRCLFRERGGDGGGDVPLVGVAVFGVVAARAVIVIRGGLDHRLREHPARRAVEVELLELRLRDDLRQDRCERVRQRDAVDHAVIREPFAEIPVEARILPPPAEPDRREQGGPLLGRHGVREIQDLEDIEEHVGKVAGREDPVPRAFPDVFIIVHLRERHVRVLRDVGIVRDRGPRLMNVAQELRVVAAERVGEEAVVEFRVRLPCPDGDLPDERPFGRIGLHDRGGGGFLRRSQVRRSRIPGLGRSPAVGARRVGALRDRPLTARRIHHAPRGPLIGIRRDPFLPDLAAADDLLRPDDAFARLRFGIGRVHVRRGEGAGREFRLGVDARLRASEIPEVLARVHGARRGRGTDGFPGGLRLFGLFGFFTRARSLRRLSVGLPSFGLPRFGLPNEGVDMAGSFVQLVPDLVHRAAHGVQRGVELGLLRGAFHRGLDPVPHAAADLLRDLDDFLGRPFLRHDGSSLCLNTIRIIPLYHPKTPVSSKAGEKKGDPGRRKIVKVPIDSECVLCYNKELPSAVPCVRIAGGGAMNEMKFYSKSTLDRGGGMCYNHLHIDRNAAKGNSRFTGRTESRRTVQGGGQWERHSPPSSRLNAGLRSRRGQ